MLRIRTEDKAGSPRESEITIIQNNTQRIYQGKGARVSKLVWPGEYKIERADWDRYISDISVMVKNVEANRTTPLSLKALVGVTAGGTILLANTLKPIIIKIGSKISTKLAAKTAGKMAAKTGGKVAAKTGGKFLGTIIAVGIIIWDVWDHYATKKKAMPVLRQNIYDYLKEVKQSILHDPSYGIMTIIYGMEQSISTN